MNQTKQSASIPKRVVIYCRVSTSMQSNNGHSLEQQATACRSYVDQRLGALGNGIVVETKFETTSGSIDFGKREIGKEVIDSLTSGDWLVCNRLDRAFRSAKDCLWVVDTLRNRNVQVHLLDLRMGDDGCVTNGIGHMFMTIMSAVAQFEREKISERTKDVKRQRASNGYFTGGKVKWEMQVVDGKLVTDEKRLKLVQTMKRLRSAGRPLRYIQQQMAARGEDVAVATIAALTNDASHAIHKRGRRTVTR